METVTMPDRDPAVFARSSQVDVVVLGGGLAGLTLVRHLLLDTDSTVLLLEKRDVLPQKRQKVGESTVQVAGYYFSKVLDLEESLLHDQLMKYNLRFYWKTGQAPNDDFADYSASYIRPFSNIASYQLDRNTFEADLLRRNQADPRCRVQLGVSKLDVELAEGDVASAGEPHRISFEAEGVRHTVSARWVVDTTGRAKVLARKLDLRRNNPVRHGAFYWWVDGLVDVDKLSARSPRQRRLDPSRRHTGHLPFWLATNHFCDEGLWFWVIPLRGKTSLGLVFDREVVDPGEVFNVEKATRWVCERFPLFARDLPHRKVLDFGGHKDFSYDCGQTLSPDRWAMTGEAGRFSDPLYSPGSDLIAIYNTLVVDAIKTEDRAALEAKCRGHEQLMRAVYQAYIPTYATSYDALGDAETFSLKYTWELTVYFAFYVFPFINDLLVERRFVPSFLKSFARLGPINQGVQRLLSGYFQWKKEHRQPPAEPVAFDFTSLAPLARAEKTFYRVGVSIEESRRVLHEQLANLEELARMVAARVASVVLGEPGLLLHNDFVAGFDLERLRFDPEGWAERWNALRDSGGQDSGGGDLEDHDYPWSFDPTVIEVYDTPPRVADPEAFTVRVPREEVAR